MTESTCVTPGGRPAYVVNVSILLRRDDRWLLIRRGAGEAHAPGTLADVGGKVDARGELAGVLESTVRREAREEIGVDLDGVPLRYVESTLFVTDDGDPIVGVLFAADLPAGAEPFAASPAEVDGIFWLTLAEAEQDPSCPPWTLRGLRHAAATI